MNFVKKFNMDLQEKMFEEVEAWRKSGLTKQVFVKDKEYTLAKFNYWVAKQSAMQTSEKNRWVSRNWFFRNKVRLVLVRHQLNINTK
jgi:predicted acetyltransferase